MTELRLIFIALSIVLGAGTVHAKRPIQPAKLVALTFPLGQSTAAQMARTITAGEPSNSYQLIPAELLNDKTLAESAQATKAAATQVAEAGRNKALEFDLVGAARLLRQAADTAASLDMMVHNPEDVTNFYLEAGAASADAEERDLAVSYFRKGLSIIEDMEPQGSLSPSARSVFEEARNSGPLGLEAPSSPELKQLCELASLQGVVWISVGKDRGEFTVYERVYTLQSRTTTPAVEHRIPVENNDPLVWAKGEQQKLNATIAQQYTQPLGSKPWYKKWWVYATAGGVIAAGIIAGFAISNAVQDPTTNITVHY